MAMDIHKKDKHIGSWQPCSSADTMGSTRLLCAALLNEDNGINGTSFSTTFINAKLLRTQATQVEKYFAEVRGLRMPVSPLRTEKTE